MKGWKEANAYGKEKITGELLESCKQGRDLLNEIYNKGINGETINMLWLAARVIDTTEAANKAIAKAEGKP